MNLTSIKLQCCDTKLSVTISPDTIHFKCSVWTSLRITQLETDIQHKRLRTQTWGGSLTHSFKQCNCWLILWHNAHIHMYTAIGQLYNETQKNATRIPQITEKGIFFVFGLYVLQPSTNTVILPVIGRYFPCTEGGRICDVVRQLLSQLHGACEDSNICSDSSTGIESSSSSSSYEWSVHSHSQNTHIFLDLSCMTSFTIHI